MRLLITLVVNNLRIKYRIKTMQIIQVSNSSKLFYTEKNTFVISTE